MRIIGGRWRGRSLVAPRGHATRPTSDKVREAIFAVLGALPETHLTISTKPAFDGPLAGHVVLDVFAGSGALGLEALSRGAATCTFIEKSRAALQALHANLEQLGIGSAGSNGRTRSPSTAEHARARVLGADVLQALQADALKGSRYTLLFVDPPYDQYEGVEPALMSCLTPLLAPAAVIVVETAARTRPAMPWRVAREKRYGDTLVTFLVAEGLHDAEGVADNDGEPS